MSVGRSHRTGGTVYYGHRRVYRGHDLLLASACVCCEITHHSGYDLLLASACVCCEITHHGGYDVLGASACVCCEITHHRGRDLLRASACVCCEHMTGCMICYEHRRVHVGITEPRPPKEDVNMVSNSNFQCIQSSNSSNLQTFKLSNFGKC